MFAEEAFPEAAALLRDAGWKPHDAWNVYTRGTIVMGFEPSGLAFHAKNWGLDVHGPDTPDDPVEAAAWLVKRFPASVAAETNDVTSPQERLTDGVESLEEFYEVHKTVGGAESIEDPGVNFGVQLEPVMVDAEFSNVEPLSLGTEILDEDEPDHGAGAFIFGDNLHEKRTAAIGLVVQIALRLMPDGVDYPRLAELRNYTMGVSEGRWPDDATKRAELDALEAIIRRANLIAAVRDEKVAGLVDATREEIEAFDPEAGWPA